MYYVFDLIASVKRKIESYQNIERYLQIYSFIIYDLLLWLCTMCRHYKPLKFKKILYYCVKVQPQTNINVTKLNFLLNKHKLMTFGRTKHCAGSHSKLSKMNTTQSHSIWWNPKILFSRSCSGCTAFPPYII